MLNNNNKLAFLQFPLYVCAPMVDQSELPFRMLTRKYGCNVAYTPMLHSKMMVNAKNYKNEHFTTCPEDRPLVAQLCGDDPETIVKAAKMLQDEVDAIDVNFGCPQGIAKRGHYGSFLLEQPQLVYKLVKALTDNVKVPIFCKIRILKTEEKTMNIVNQIVQAGCSLLTVHGRTKEQNKDRVGSCDWKIIKKIKNQIDIPVIANGGVYQYGDVQRCLEETIVDGVMSAQALLQNPALFSGKIHDLDDIALEYLHLAQKHPGASTSCIRGHLFKILFTGLQQHTDLRDLLVKANGMDDFMHIVKSLRQRRENVPAIDKLGWYMRYQKKVIQLQKQKMQLQQQQQKGIQQMEKIDQKHIIIPEQPITNQNSIKKVMIVAEQQ